MAKKPKEIRFQNSQEVFTRFIPGYHPDITPSYDDMANYGLSSRTGSALGRSLASQIKQALGKSGAQQQVPGDVPAAAARRQGRT